MTPKPDVPDRAVEAAAKAIYEDAVGITWREDCDDPRIHWLDLARIAVEAAAPHIIEQFIDGLKSKND